MSSPVGLRPRVAEPYSPMVNRPRMRRRKDLAGGAECRAAARRCGLTSMTLADIATREMTPEPTGSLAPAASATRPEPEAAAAPPAGWVHALACLTRAWHPKGTDWLLRKIYPPGHRRAVRTVLEYDDGLLIHIDTAS